MPAQVAGTWTIEGAPQPLTVQIQQKFQVIDGTATVNGRSVPLENASLRGDAIAFTVAGDGGKPMSFSGRVNGNTMEPRADAGGGVTGWIAVRTSPVPSSRAVIRSRG